ncbi:hypothetical protein, partial [Streptococcus pneumoniae]|uniref:hypothetical protein n=1 Tax=Streptococcus pneumoniae TaxID=1313 RepID=UPI001CEDF278
KLQKTDFYRPEYQKRKDEICPFSSLAFFQPTTVDKEPKNIAYCAEGIAHTIPSTKPSVV